MKIINLLSGSKGNCTLVMSGGGNLLIDCGSTYTKIKEQLGKAGLSFGDIGGVLVTHSHIDHVSALPVAMRKNPFLKVYVHKDGARELFERTLAEAELFEDKFEAGGIEVQTYRCHHDASCCNGFRMSDGENTACYVTDTGCVDQKLIDFLKGANKIVIESNHDYRMLVLGKYTAALKRRIAGANGHLSNEQTAYLLERADLAWAKEIVLAHLSENNNLPRLAEQSAKEVLDKLGLTETVRLSVAAQWEVCE